MTGKIEGMGFTKGISKMMPELIEAARRKPCAFGTPVLLADGQQWLLANPTYRVGNPRLTEPAVDRPLDRIFESSVLDEGLSITDLWEVARELLLANYELTEIEVAKLLSFGTEDESRLLASGILDTLFGIQSDSKAYTSWVRASLLANGLTQSSIHANDILNVLAILVATNRTIPLSKFADACRVQDERAKLETLL